MEQFNYRHGDGVLLDLSDEYKVTIPQAILSSAEYDDTFGLYKKHPISLPSVSVVDEVSSKGQGQGEEELGPGSIKCVADENGNPLNESFDMGKANILDISALSQFPSITEIEQCIDVPSKAQRQMPCTKLTVERNPLSPAMLHATALEIHAIHAKIMAEDIVNNAAFQPRSFDWKVEDIPQIVASFSRVNEIMAEIHQLFQQTKIVAVSPKILPSSPVTLPSPVQVEPKSAGSTGQSRPESAPPSPTFCRQEGSFRKGKDTSLSLRSLDEGIEPVKSGPTGLRRTQSCASSAPTRQFLPPIMASSPRSFRSSGGDAHRSASMEKDLQRQTSFKQSSSMGNVKSSGYGKPTMSKMPPPSPKFAPSPIRSRSRNSIAVMSSPQHEQATGYQPIIRPLARGTPPRSNVKVNLDSTFVKSNGHAAASTSASASTKDITGSTSNTTVTLPKIMRVASNTSVPRNGRVDLNVTQVKAGLAHPGTLKGPAPSTASASTTKTLNATNKFGFRK